MSFSYTIGAALALLGIVAVAAAGEALKPRPVADETGAYYATDFDRDKLVKEAQDKGCTDIKIERRVENGLEFFECFARQPTLRK